MSKDIQNFTQCHSISCTLIMIKRSYDMKIHILCMLLDLPISFSLT
jgi:hypothetical protein